ncbi:MAG: thioredoxin family protein [Pseudomonadota bacterium]
MFCSRSFIRLVCLFALAVQAHAAQTPALPDYSRGYDPTRDPFADGEAALELARNTNRKVLIEVGGEWCSWCHVLDRFLNEHAQLRSRLHETFVLLKVSVDATNDNAEFLSVFPRTQGYPHMYITDTGGTILFSQDTAVFLQDGRYSEQRFQAFLDRWSNKHD